MAINPSGPLFHQAMSTPRSSKARVAQAEFRLPEPAGARSPEAAFELATQQFGESLQGLSPADRKEIQIIHGAVDQWATSHPGGDRLGQFVVRVMAYADKRLTALEAQGKGPPECKGLESVFLSGYRMIGVYTSL